jgi:hypothetical protein
MAKDKNELILNNVELDDLFMLIESEIQNDSLPEDYLGRMTALYDRIGEMIKTKTEEGDYK